MPFITLKTNKSISKESEVNIKSKLGEAIKIIGKTESWLMINFEDNQKMYFRGESSFDMAFVSVDLYGSASKSSYNLMTEEITNILKDELEIESDKIYVKYGEIENFGYNGRNF
jgi:2C-methyl-D-erythritol 2,4-cyclodiphosphate synthase